MPVKHTFVSAKTQGADATVVSKNEWNDAHSITAFELSGDTSPSQIAADQNDYNPSGLADTAVLRLTSDAMRTLTGIAGGSDGRILIIHNVGDYPITLKRESASSTAANRFAAAQDITIFPNEGTLLQYDSTSSRWRTLDDIAPQEEDIVDLSDEFMPLSTETGEIGAMGWSSSAAGTAQNAPGNSATNHPGVFTIGSGTTSGNNTRLHLGPNSTQGIFAADQLVYLGAIVRIPTITSIKVRIGIGADVSGATFGTDGAWFEFDPSADASWRCITRVSNNNEGPTDTAVDVVATNWYLLEIYRNPTSGNWEFYVNGVKLATHSTQKPSAVMQAGFYVETATTASRTLDIDWFRLRLAAMGQRWT